MTQKTDKNSNVRTWNSDMRDEIVSSFVKNLPSLNENVSFDLTDKYIKKPLTFKRKIREIFFPSENGLTKRVEGIYPESLLEFHEGWVDFYKNFGETIDLANFPLPKNLILEEGKEYWSIVVPDSMNPQKAFELRKQITIVYENTSVARIIDVFPRMKVSVIRAEQNAKVLHPHISLNHSMKLGLCGTTFTEGCIIDGRIFKDNGMHLDVDGWTLHCGSRNEHGDAVSSDWCAGRFLVSWSNPDNAGPNLSIRQKQF